MKRLIVCTALLAAGVGFAMFCAEKANADEASYLADLQASNIPVLSQPKAVSDGYRVCRDIRDGQSPESAAQTFGPYYNLVGAQIVDIARRNLCPDTLHN
ncbi:DUF732 domain-containing protein [Mycobacterium sp. 1245499.0]|uniref:DUF732 domain-containing protein n=1 Tax=Mycobacterium sp. 1245499.0 TaxID=1834074 RepID=UPI0008314EB0|nr:DUF732 domain-containing protein [Mycobacterium sp. 1245499.0]